MTISCVNHVSVLLSIIYVEMERPQNTVETMENNESNSSYCVIVRVRVVLKRTVAGD